MDVKAKPAVLNPIVFRNTVGAELVDILEARGIKNYEVLLNVKNLPSKEKLSKSILKKLGKVIEDYSGVIDFLENFQADYFEEKKRCQLSYATAKKNYTRLKNARLLMRGEFNEGYDILDDIIDFFGVNNEEEIFTASEAQAALFRTQNNVGVDSINLYVWLRRGELDFYNMSVSLPQYNEQALKGWIDNREWLSNIENPNYFKGLPDIFRQFGIALTLVPYLEKTVYGAVRWIDGHPLIEISDRNRDLATCWFTLFHELGHIIKHKNKEIYEGEINTTTSNNCEREANKFANKYLFNGDSLRKAVFQRKNGLERMTANGLAQEFGVKAIFSAYWLRRAQYQPALQPHISIDFTESYQ